MKLKEEIYVSKKTGLVYITNGMKIDIETPVERDLTKYKQFAENNAFKIYREK